MALISHRQSQLVYSPTPVAHDLDEAIRIFCHFGLNDCLRERSVPSQANGTQLQDICACSLSAGLLSWQAMYLELPVPTVKENLPENDGNTEKHSGIWVYASVISKQELLLDF